MVFGTDLARALRLEREGGLRRRVESVNGIWRTDIHDPDAERLTAGFHEVQYAPWYDGETCSVDRPGWPEGNPQVAQAGLGKGWHWSVGDVRFSPRSADEAIAVDTVVHRFGVEPTTPVEVGFLETWVRPDGRWHLHRHTAEERSDQFVAGFSVRTRRPAGQARPRRDNACSLS